MSEAQHTQTPTEGTTQPTASPQNDAEKNKLMAILAYTLFFLPLVTDSKDSPFAKFHANQGLVLLLFAVVSQVVSGMLVFVLIGLLLLPLSGLFTFILWIVGMINANNGEMKPLPLIGGITLIK